MRYTAVYRNTVRYTEMSVRLRFSKIDIPNFRYTAMRYTENSVRYRYDIFLYRNLRYGMWYGILGTVYRTVPALGMLYSDLFCYSVFYMFKLISLREMKIVVSQSQNFVDAAFHSYFSTLGNGPHCMLRFVQLFYEVRLPGLVSFSC